MNERTCKHAERSRSILSAGLIMALALCLIFAWGLIRPVYGDTSGPMKVFHLDNGRKYFSSDELFDLIDALDTNDYTHMELAIGNDGLRFLLDNMSLDTGSVAYTSDEVREAIHQGNLAYNRYRNYETAVNELTQDEMDEVIDYARNHGIEIIPMVNTPGHMNAIVTAMVKLGIENPGYGSGTSSLNTGNEEAMSFTRELLILYMDYFQSRGCTFFNLACDEYGDKGGFQGLIDEGRYEEFIAYINSLAALAKERNLTPIAFNDGFYYNNYQPSGIDFDRDILIAYWHSGWAGYSLCPAPTLADKGFKILNTHREWYYVLGGKSGCTYDGAKRGMAAYSYRMVMGQGKNAMSADDVVGCMFAVWSDDPTVAFEGTVREHVFDLIGYMAQTHGIFNPKEGPTVKTLKIPQGAILTYNGKIRTGVPAGTGYTIKGNTAKDAGLYTAVLTARRGYVWPDGEGGSVTVEYRIDKAILKATYQSETIPWYGTPKMAVKVTGFVGGETASTAAGYKAPAAKRPGVNPGSTYSVTPSGGSATNYRFDYGKGTLTVKIKDVMVLSTTASGKTLSFKWTKVPGATGYKVYGSLCNTGKKKYTPTLKKTVKSGTAASCSLGGQKAGEYKYYAIAYRVEKGRTITLAKTPLTHTVVGSKKYTNGIRVTVPKRTVSITKGSAYTIKPKVSYNTRYRQLTHEKTARYLSTDTRVATVTAGGKVTGKGKGTCRIYVFANDGVWTTVTVTVK